MATFAVVVSWLVFALANPNASAVAGVVQVIEAKSENTPPFIVERLTKSVEAGSALLVGNEVVPQV